MSNSSSILFFWIIYHWGHTYYCIIHAPYGQLPPRIDFYYTAPLHNQHEQLRRHWNQPESSLDWNHISEQSSCCSYSQKYHTPPTPANIAFRKAEPNKWEWEPFNLWQCTTVNTVSQWHDGVSWCLTIITTVTQFLTSVIGWEQTQLVSKLSISHDEQPCQWCCCCPLYYSWP